MHFVSQCEALSEERRNLLRWMGGWHNFGPLAIDQLLIDFGQLAYQFPVINAIHHLVLHWDTVYKISLSAVCSFELCQRFYTMNPGKVLNR